MLKEYKLNHELSMEVRNKMGDVLVMKECYTNIFHSLRFFVEKFRSQEWAIAYGYIRVLENQPLMARHCFIVTKEGEAIDPTLMNISGYTKGQDRKHVTFAEFDDMEKYLEAITKNDNCPDLVHYFRKREQTISQKWAMEKGVVLLG